MITETSGIVRFISPGVNPGPPGPPKKLLQFLDSNFTQSPNHTPILRGGPLNFMFIPVSVEDSFCIPKTLKGCVSPPSSVVWGHFTYFVPTV
jgi:hypothetical protein